MTEQHAPADPIPEFLAEAHNLAAELLLRHGIPHELNQSGLAQYEQGVGVGSHTEKPALGRVVVTLGLQGSVPIEFTPMEGGPTTAVYHRRCRILAMTGESLQRYKRGIKAMNQEIVEGETVARTARLSVIFRIVPPPRKNEE